MGYYLDPTDIVNLLPGGATIGINTAGINLGDVASIITAYEAEVDGFAAAAGYTVPISTAATYAYATLQKAVRNGAGGFVLGVLFPNMGGMGDKTSLSATYRQAYLDFQKALSSGSMTLVGAGQEADGGGHALPRGGGFGRCRQPVDLHTKF